MLLFDQWEIQINWDGVTFVFTKSTATWDRLLFKVKKIGSLTEVAQAIPILACYDV